MSDIVSGVAAAAIGACKIVSRAGCATYQAFSWLSAHGQREMERLAQELSRPVPTHTTTTEARKAFEEQTALIKVQVNKHAVLRPHSDAVARVLALRSSPLGLFVSQDQWTRLYQAATRTHKASFASIVDQAARRFTQANATCVCRSIVEVAQRVGFTRPRAILDKRGKRFLTMEDDLGRALVAEVAKSDEGAKLNLDLTGFSDGSCHRVMDRILEGLAEKDIHLNRLRRGSHYRREGVLTSMPAGSQKPEPEIQTFPDEERQRALKRRLQHHCVNNRSKLKEVR